MGNSSVICNVTGPLLSGLPQGFPPTPCNTPAVHLHEWRPQSGRSASKASASQEAQGRPMAHLQHIVLSCHLSGCPVPISQEETDGEERLRRGNADHSFAAPCCFVP